MSAITWPEIIIAYGNWIAGLGPPVQYLPPSAPGTWKDWLHETHIDIDCSRRREWRIKSRPIRSRQFYEKLACPASYLTGTVIWRPAECEPNPPPGGKWLGDWIDIPDTEDD
jgi:hypothetical protein